MNTLEEQIELGSMVQERRRIKSRLDCTKNKLNKYRKTLEQTAFSMNYVSDTTISGFKLSNDSNEFSVLSVPGTMGFEKDRRFPSREELAQGLKDYIYLKNRLDELDDLLS